MKSMAGGKFGPRKLRKVTKGAKVYLLARLLFLYFVGFRDLCVPNPFPQASDVLAILGGGSSAQQGVACSRRGGGLDHESCERSRKTRKPAYWQGTFSRVSWASVTFVFQTLSATPQMSLPFSVTVPPRSEAWRAHSGGETYTCLLSNASAFSTPCSPARCFKNRQPYQTVAPVVQDNPFV